MLHKRPGIFNFLFLFHFVIIFYNLFSHPLSSRPLFLVVLHNGVKNINVKNTWFVTCIRTENTAKQSTEKHLYIPHYFCSFYKILRGRCSGDPSFLTFLNQEIHSRKVFEILKGDTKIFQVIYFESLTSGNFFQN